MIYEKAKVYYDGSHHIAIPHTTRWLKPRRKFKEKEIVVGEDGKPAEDKLEPSVLVTEEGDSLSYEVQHLIKNRQHSNFCVQ